MRTAAAVTNRRFRDLGARDHVDAAFTIALRQRVGRFGVFDWQDARQRFDQRDLHAERLEDVRELHADRARADDREGFRHALEQQRFIGRDDGRLVDFEADLGNAFDPGARGDHDGLLRLVHVAADFHFLAGLHDTGSLHDGDLVLLHQKLDALGILIAHSAGALHGNAVIGLHAARFDAEFLRFLQ